MVEREPTRIAHDILSESYIRGRRISVRQMYAIETVRESIDRPDSVDPDAV